MKIFQKSGIASLLVAVMMISPVALAAPAAPVISLGAASTFAIVSGGTTPTAFTNADTSTVIGDIGTLEVAGTLPVGVTQTGDFEPGNDAEAIAAQAAVSAAYDAAALPTTGEELVGDLNQLDGLTLSPGLYYFDDTLVDGDTNLTTTLTLNAGGDVNAVWVIQTDGQFVMGDNSSIVLTNGAQSNNVFFQAEVSATLGENSSFVGNLLVNNDITLEDGASVRGRVLSVLGDVALDDGTVNMTNLAAAVTPVVTPALPATGFGSSQSILLSILALVGVMGVASLSFVAMKKANK